MGAETGVRGAMFQASAAGALAVSDSHMPPFLEMCSQPTGAHPGGYPAAAGPQPVSGLRAASGHLCGVFTLQRPPWVRPRPDFARDSELALPLPLSSPASLAVLQVSLGVLP